MALLGQAIAYLFIVGIILLVGRLLGITISTFDRLKEKNNAKQKNREIQQKSIEIYSLLDQLHRTYKIQNPVNDSLIRKHFDERNFAGVINEIKNKMGLSNKVLVKCYSDDKYPRENSNGFVDIPGNIPMINTPAFNNFRFVISIKESAQSKYETFIYVLAHELSHIVLHTMRHPLKDSEKATDLFVMVRGFNEIMGKGIKDFYKEGSTKRDGFTKNEYSYTINSGYLDIDSFNIANEYIYSLFKKQNSRL